MSSLAELGKAMILVLKQDYPKTVLEVKDFKALTRQKN